MSEHEFHISASLHLWIATPRKDDPRPFVLHRDPCLAKGPAYVQESKA